MTLNAISSPDKMTIHQILLSSAQEIFGEGDVCTNFSQGKQECEQSNVHIIEEFQSFLQKQCGCTGGRGAAILAGRSMFNTILQCAGDALGWFDSGFAMLPISQRLKKGLQDLALQWGKMNHREIILQEKADHWLWLQSMPPFQDKSTSQPCDLTVGMLQGYTCWVSGGKFFDIQEISQDAEEETMRVIAISKRAID